MTNANIKGIPKAIVPAPRKHPQHRAKPKPKQKTYKAPTPGTVDQSGGGVRINVADLVRPPDTSGTDIVDALFNSEPGRVMRGSKPDVTKKVTLPKGSPTIKTPTKSDARNTFRDFAAAVTVETVMSKPRPKKPPKF